MIVETNAEDYEYFLGVLPPVFMGREVTLVTGDQQYADFGFAEGAERIVAFWHKDGRYFKCPTTLINRPWGSSLHPSGF